MSKGQFWFYFILTCFCSSCNGHGVISKWLLKPTPTFDMLDIFSIGATALVDANNNCQIDEADSPLQGANLYFTDSKGQQKLAVTDAQGEAVINNPGYNFPYQMQMSAPSELNLIPLSNTIILKREDVFRIDTRFLFVSVVAPVCLQSLGTPP